MSAEQEPIGQSVWEATGTEPELVSKDAYWIKGKVTSQQGRLTLTAEQLLFTAEAGSVTQGGALAQAIVDRIADGRDVSMPLAEITAARRTRHGFVRNTINVELDDRTYRFTPGWKQWAQVLREAVEATGRTIVDVGSDAWEVTGVA